ncbi:MAG: ParB/RepB/Spo0J family partition protein [Thermoproteota archaeon]|nr:ParB/RepB/Spo0J family partition protein [Thermoproteota archaeon]
MDVSIDLIQSAPYQPRLVFEIEKLKEEIKRDGLLTDLVVRRKDEFYELVDGERRWRVLKELGWRQVPVRVVELDDQMARRSVYKLNKIRKNYTVEEEARYFRRLAEEEGLSAWEISKELNVDFHWVKGHLNVFKFPKHVQKAVWSGQLSVSHIVALEKMINQDVKDTVLVVDQVLEKGLTVDETRSTVRAREKKLEKMRVKEAKEVLLDVAPEKAKLETSQDFLEAAKMLQRIAKWRQKGRQEAKMEEKTVEGEALESLEPLVEVGEEVVLGEDVLEKAEQQGVNEDFIEKLRGLRERIRSLEREKIHLLEQKSYFLTKALSFNCPHCNNPVVVYREGDRYWAEKPSKI